MPAQTVRTWLGAHCDKRRARFALSLTLAADLLLPDFPLSLLPCCCPAAVLLQLLAGVCQAHVPDAPAAVCARRRGAIHQPHQQRL